MWFGTSCYIYKESNKEWSRQAHVLLCLQENSSNNTIGIIYKIGSVLNLSIGQIKSIEKIYDRVKNTADWQKEIECLSALRHLCVQEGDRKKEAVRYNNLWKDALETALRKYGKVLSREAVNQYLCDVRNAYKFAARYDFRSFLVFMEWERKPQDKFYHPRKKVLDPVINDMQKLIDGELDILAVSLPPRCGKEQPLSSKILTPDGWITMKNVEIGTQVIGFDGNPCSVTGIFPQGIKDIYNVKFDDGTIVRCGYEHLWTVQTREDRKTGRERTITTGELIKDLYVENGKRKNYSIKYVDPVNFSKKTVDRDLHPYLLGALIGDGCFCSGGISFCNPEKEILDKIDSILPNDCFLNRQKDKGEKDHRIVGKIDNKENHTLKMIREYGLYGKHSYDKFIPKHFLYSSIEDRIELLRGLMDTDGYARNNKISYSEYSTTSKQLAEDMLELIRSLGGRATVSSKISHYTKDGERHVCRRSYRILFNTTINPFYILRKSKNFVARTKRNVKYITGIEKTDREECQCIMVDSPKHLYVTDGYNLTHNTTLGLLYILFIAGRFPEKCVFGTGHSDPLMASFYDGIMEFAKSGIYTYKEIFPESQIVDTNAKNHQIDFGSVKRYPTITFSSIGTNISGRIEATSLLYIDDLISGAEEAGKPERVLNTYKLYETDTRQRRKENVPMLIMGTRWSMYDPMGFEERFGANNPRAKFINIPALDEETGESNFDYEYGVGFSTKYYREEKERKDAIDPAIFSTIYQGKPIESEGVCFTNSSLKRFSNLPQEGYVGTYLFGDCAWGGGDSFSAPIGRKYQIGEEIRIYIVDWVFTRELKEISKPLIIESIFKNQVQRVKFEANNGGDQFKEDIEKDLKRLGYRAEVMSERADNKQAKTDKILNSAGDIKEHFYFLTDSLQPQPYRLAMVELTSWLRTGKSPHDDAPDSLTGLCEMALGSNKGKFYTLKTRFGL